MTMQRSLAGGLHPSLLADMTETARTVGVAQRKQLEAALAAEAAVSAPKVAFLA